MEYKTIEELYTSLGVAGAIIVVFLGIFVYTIIQNDKRRNNEIMQNDKRRNNEINNIVDKLGALQINDTNFQNAMNNLSEAIKELSATNKIVADTVSRLDYYNKDLNRKLDRHDEKCDKILDAVKR